MSADQKSAMHVKKGPLRDPMLDDVEDFKHMDQVTRLLRLYVILNFEVNLNLL